MPAASGETRGTRVLHEEVPWFSPTPVETVFARVVSHYAVAALLASRFAPRGYAGQAEGQVAESERKPLRKNPIMAVRP